MEGSLVENPPIYSARRFEKEVSTPCSNLRILSILIAETNKIMNTEKILNKCALR